MDKKEKREKKEIVKNPVRELRDYLKENYKGKSFELTIEDEEYNPLFTIRDAEGYKVLEERSYELERKLIEYEHTVKILLKTFANLITKKNE